MFLFFPSFWFIPPLRWLGRCSISRGTWGILWRTRARRASSLAPFACINVFFFFAKAVKRVGRARPRPALENSTGLVTSARMMMGMDVIRLRSSTTTNSELGRSDFYKHGTHLTRFTINKRKKNGRARWVFRCSRLERRYEFINRQTFSFFFLSFFIPPLSTERRLSIVVARKYFPFLSLLCWIWWRLPDCLVITWHSSVSPWSSIPVCLASRDTSLLFFPVIPLAGHRFQNSKPSRLFISTKKRIREQLSSSSSSL